MCGCSEHSWWLSISRTTFFVMPGPRSTNLHATCVQKRRRIPLLCNGHQPYDHVQQGMPNCSES